MTSSRSLRFAAFLLLFVLPFALRILPLKHGGERGYIPDAHMVRQALGMARDRDPVPPVGKYSTYPNLVPYVSIPLLGAQYVAGTLRGEWQDPKEYGDVLLEHPQRAAWVVRFVVALFGALTPWVIYRAARAAGLGAGAWAAAWLVATGLLHVQFSTQERPWVPMVFFLALSAWAAIVYASSLKRVHLTLCGITAGLAFACHQSGLAALAIPFCAWLFASLGWRAVALRERFVSGFLAVAGFVVAGVLLGHPYLIVHGRTPTDAVVGQGAADASLGGMSLNFGVRWESLARLAPAFFGYDPVLVLLGLGGLVFALRDRRLRPVLVFTIAWAAFFLVNPSDHVRYLLPVAVLLALPAGMLVERWWVQPFGRYAAPLLLAVPLIQALRFDHLLLRTDTRAIAEKKLAALAPGQRVVIDRYGPFVDASQTGLVVLERLRATCNQSLRPREEYRKRELAAGTVAGGIDAIRAEDLFTFDVAGSYEREQELAVIDCLAKELGREPAAAMRQLGVTHVLLVDRRIAEPSRLLARGAGERSVWSVDPSSSSDRPTREAFLPTEMDFPLTGLWSVERPGPVMELVELP
jgi:hypothetical protein